MKVGEAIFAFSARPDVTSDEFAFKSKAACAEVDSGLFASLVLSIFPKPTIVFVIPLTVPVKVGEAIFAFSARPDVTSDEFAFKSKAACAEVDSGLFASLVLSIFPKPTIVFVIPLTVPVKVGEAIFAFSARSDVTSDVFAFSAR